LRDVLATFAEHLEKVLGWESVYAWNQETFRSDDTLGRTDTREAIYKKLSERRDAVDVTGLLNTVGVATALLHKLDLGKEGG